MVIIIVVLSVALIVCVALVLLLKNDIRLLEQSLQTIKQTNTNMRLSTTTFDKDICMLCNTINDILDKQKEIIILSEKSNTKFRQAITNISHDLRTPLTSAIGYIQMLKSDKTPNDKKEEYLNIIEYRLKTLSNLMNELFEYTQITEGKIKQNIERINICNILRDIISTFYIDLTEKNFAVQIDIPDKPVFALGDADLLKRVVANLIQNVLAHGIEQFNLVVDAKNGSISFQNKVANSDMLDIDRLFDRFYTFDFSRNGKNTGLGLAIAKELIQNMRGEIKALSKDNMLEIKVYLPVII